MRGKCRRPAPPDGDGDATAVLGDADLEEILLRLPSPADLARSAALVCRRWRGVSSAPAFLRRFRRLHPPQLLGFFICKGGHPNRYDALDRSPLPVLDPTFLPVVPPNSGVGGAVGRCRDFSLSSLPTVNHWSLADSRDGLLLFNSSCNRSTDFCGNVGLRDIPEHFAVCDPLSGHSILLPALDAGLYADSYYLGAALVISDKDEGGTGIFSFEVLIATYIREKRPCLCAFSSSSRQWVELPCPDTYKLYKFRTPWIDDGARDSGHVYWVVHVWDMDNVWGMESMDYEHILVLDLQTKKFSTINLPCRGMCDKYDRNIKVMRSEGDRDLRVVAIAWSSCELHFWRRDWSRSAKGRWVKEDVVCFLGVEGWLDLIMGGRNSHGFGNSYGNRIVDAGEGFVFIKYYETPWVFVLNLKEMTTQKLPNRERFCGHALPYRMALSPRLLNFSQEGNR